MDLGVVVDIHPLVNDLAVELLELEFSRVILVMATQAKPVLVGLLRVEMKQLAELRIVRVFGMAGRGSVAILALISGQMRRFLFGFPARIVFEARGVAGNAFGVERRVRLGVAQK